MTTIKVKAYNWTTRVEDITQEVFSWLCPSERAVARHVCRDWYEANYGHDEVGPDMLVSTELANWVCDLGCDWSSEVFLDAGARCANRALVQWALADGAEPEETACTAAAATGDIEFISWLRYGLGFPWWGHQVAIAAAEHGHEDLLAWLYARGIKGRACAFQVAAREGHLHVLQWARRFSTRRHWAQESTCASAARGGHLHVLQWARAQDPPCPWGAEVCSSAAAGGHLHVLQWARARGCPWDLGRVCARAAAYGRLALIQRLVGGDPLLDEKEQASVLHWAAEGGGPLCAPVPGREPWDRVRSLCETAAAGGHLAVLRWARRRGFAWGDACGEAARHRALAALRWAVAHGCPVDLAAVRDMIARTWATQWSEPDSVQGIHRAAGLRWVARVRWARAAAALRRR